MNTFERLRKGIFLSKDTEEKEKDNIVSEKPDETGIYIYKYFFLFLKDNIDRN